MSKRVSTPEAILNLKIGKIFRISHLVDFNKLMLARTLYSFEMGLMKSKIFYNKGEVPKH
jgi:alanine-glyoxylate transaminase/serine-glyoxylate transaminase/serine-pyruvate transaminase